MRKIAFITNIFLALLIFVQAKAADPVDTITFRELIISAFRPATDDAMVSFYKSSQFASIDDITERLGGVSLMRRGSYAMEPVLNGMSGARINITIDGMKMFGACTDNMDPITSYIEPFNLSSIQVMHGTGGNSQGNNIGGSLNLLTEKAVPGKGEPFKLQTAFAYNSNSMGLDGNVGMVFNRERWALLVNATYREHQPYFDGNKQKVAFSQFGKANVHSSFVYALSKKRLLSADVILDEAFDVGYPALPMDVSRASGKIYGVDYKWFGSGKVQRLKVKLYGNNVYHVMDDSQRDSVYVLNNDERDTVVMKMDMPGWSDTYGTYAEADVKLTDKSSLFVKLDNYTNFIRADMTMYMRNYRAPGEPPMFVETWPRTRRMSNGIFAEYSLKPVKAIEFVANVRTDLVATKMLSEFGQKQFSIFGYDLSETDYRNTFGANAQIRYIPQIHWMLEVGGGLGERVPGMSESYGFYLFNAFDAYDYVGNPELKNERALTANIKTAYSSRKVRFTFDMSYKHIQDYIYGLTNNSVNTMNLYAVGTRVYQNTQSARVFGTSAYLQWMPMDRLSLVSSATYTNASFVNGEVLPLIQPLTVYSTLTYKWAGITFRFDSEWAAAKKKVNKDYNETPTSAYAVFNFNVRKNIAMGQHTLSLSVGSNNIFNKAYKQHLDWGPVLRPGRTFTIQAHIML